MTLTPIPEEFTKAMHARAVQYGGGRSGYESFTDGAEWAYRLLASQQTMRWVKCSERLPDETTGVIFRDTVTKAVYGDFHGMLNDTIFFEGRNDDLYVDRNRVEWLLDESPAPTT